MRFFTRSDLLVSLEVEILIWQGDDLVSTPTFLPASPSTRIRELIDKRLSESQPDINCQPLVLLNSFLVNIIRSSPSN